MHRSATFDPRFKQSQHGYVDTIDTIGTIGTMSNGHSPPFFLFRCVTTFGPLQAQSTWLEIAASSALGRFDGKPGPLLSASQPIRSIDPLIDRITHLCCVHNRVRAQQAVSVYCQVRRKNIEFLGFYE